MDGMTINHIVSIDHGSYVTVLLHTKKRSAVMARAPERLVLFQTSKVHVNVDSDGVNISMGWLGWPSGKGFLQCIGIYGYGSIPMKIPFLGEWTSIYQLFWCEQKGYKVLTHCHIGIFLESLRILQKNIEHPVPCDVTVAFHEVSRLRRAS